MKNTRDNLLEAYGKLSDKQRKDLLKPMNEELNKELIAKICHNVNKVYCESMGDHSQPDWDVAPDWQKESVIIGVEYYLNGERSPEQGHINWMGERVYNGWVYGKLKCVDKKTHPCIVPYDELPQEQKTKDSLFKAVVDSFKSNPKPSHEHSHTPQTEQGENDPF